MAYTTFTEVQSDFKSTTFTSTTNVTDSDVTQFIVEADALINSYVSKVYETPVTSGEGLQLLKLFSRSLTAARIKKIMEVVQEKSTDANQNVLTVLLTPSAVLKQLESIANKKTELIGATLLVSSGGFFNNNNYNCAEAVIKKDEKQW